MNCSVPWLFGAVLERAAKNRQRMRFTQRSKPAGALQPALTGVYVQLVPPSFEYSIAAVTPAGRVAEALETLYCTLEGIESTTARFDALALPVLVTVDVKVRSVPGAGVPPGLTAFVIEIAGLTTITISAAVDVLALFPTERPLRKRVSIVPAATLPIWYVTITGTVAPLARGARRALSGLAACVMLVPVIDATLIAVPGLFDVRR